VSSRSRLHLKSADVDRAANDAWEAGAALIEGRSIGVVTGINGKASREQDHRLSRAAVVLQGTRKPQGGVPGVRPMAADLAFRS
jgi:hypothetical protein